MLETKRVENPILITPPLYPYYVPGRFSIIDIIGLFNIKNII